MAQQAITSVQLDELLLKYFYSWRPYKLILARLNEVHGIQRGLTWLKEQFERLQLTRKGTYAPDGIVQNCIRRELRTSNCQVGYRAMWKILRDKYLVIARRDRVMEHMRALDRSGVSRRRSHRLQRRVYLSKGPNFCWHVDGYDKLSPYGFYIHGCIDGFSRKMLWLRVASTNRNPSVILQYYLECIEEVNGCPAIVRIDHGTENGLLAAAQIGFRSSCTDDYAGRKSLRYGSSPANVRIEGWWSQLRRHKTGWWILTFKVTKLQELIEEGYYDSNDDKHQKCLAVVFFPVLERELREFMVHWNTHPIRHNRLANCPSGVPEDMFDMPNHYGCENYLQTVDSHLWMRYMTTDAQEPPLPYSQVFSLQCHQLVLQNFGLDLHRDVTSTNCVMLYQFLVRNL